MKNNLSYIVFYAPLNTQSTLAQSTNKKFERNNLFLKIYEHYSVFHMKRIPFQLSHEITSLIFSRKKYSSAHQLHKYILTFSFFDLGQKLGWLQDHVYIGGDHVSVIFSFMWTGYDKMITKYLIKILTSVIKVTK